jgi:CHASE2 domain-containing sensor protein
MKLLLKQSLLITLLMFIMIWVLSSFPLHFEYFNPIQNAFKDFDITDMVFSKIRKNPKYDDRIVVVNIGKLNRGEIGQLLEKIAEHQPKIIGIDAFFRNLKGNAGDTILHNSLQKCKNVVFVSELKDFNEKKGCYDVLNVSHPFFTKNFQNGFANLTTTGEENMAALVTCRSFLPQAQVNKKTELAFGVKIAELYDKNKTKKFLNRKNVSEYINYNGNIDVAQKSVGAKETVFTSLDFTDVFDDNFKPEVFKDKIVLLGFMGNSLKENSFEDKFYTPLNENYVGKSTPDMYGIVIHANIISMILNQNFIDEMNDYINIGLAIVFGFLSVLLFSFFFKNLGFWFDSATLIMQFLFAILLFTINVVAFHQFNLRININLALACAVLSGLMVEFYFGLFVKLYEKMKRKPEKEYIQ